MNNLFYKKHIKLNPDIIFDYEKIEGEGAIIIDNNNNKVHFLNLTALMIYEEIKDNTILDVYDRYKNQVNEKYVNVNEIDIKKSFEELVNELVKLNIVIIYD